MRDARRDKAALALIAVLGVLYALIAKLAFDGFPYSGDEYSLWLQAELFARGILHTPMPAHAEWLRVDHVILDGLVRSKYPPGTSALLSLGMRAGVPWLVTPIEGVLALIATWWTTRRLLGAREALIAVALVGLAPLFAFESATFYSHTAVVLFLAIAYACVAEHTRTDRVGWLVGCGFALGCAFLCRPVDALLFGIAMCSLRSMRAIVVTAVSALPVVALSFVYQAAQFGSPLTDGYHLYGPTMHALYGPEASQTAISPAYLIDPVQHWFHLDYLRSFCLDWTVPGTVLLAVFGAYAIGRGHAVRPMRTFSLALVAVYLGILVVLMADPDDGPRVRYLSPLLVPVAVLAAAGFAPAMSAVAGRFGRRAPAIAMTIAVVFGIGSLASHVIARLPRQWQREGLYQAVDAAHVGRAAVIVRADHPSRYARNGAWFDGDALYLSAPDIDPAAAHAAYPDRAVWEAVEPRIGNPWQLTRRY